VASALTALGLVLQKYSHTDNERCGKTRLYYKQPWWLMGLAIFGIGQAVNLIAMALTPQTMLSCLGALSLVFNAVFAWSILRETVRTSEILPMAGMILGALLVVASTPVAPSHRHASAGEIIGGAMWQFFFVLTAALLLVLLGALWLAAKRKAATL
ncbi:unnamed protein product, partial [Polarella glacialis]